MKARLASIILFNLLLVFFMPAISHAQNNGNSRAELEKRKQQLQQEIDEATQNLNDTKKNHKLTVRQVQLLQNKISLRNKLIANINDDINAINGNINAAYRDIKNSERDLDTLKAQYAQLVIYAYKNRSSYDYLNFIFSANSFNDAIKRFQYLKQYREFRERQASSIVKNEALLKQKIANLNSFKKERSAALGSVEDQRKTLEKEKNEKAQIVNTLKGREKELLADINEKKRAQKKLSATITLLIRREIEEARRKAAEVAAAKAKAAAAAKKNNPAVAKNNAPATTTPAATDETTVASNRPANVLEATPEERMTSENFEGNKGKLPWPVEKGMIVDPFGVHQHPVLSKVTIDNKGVNIDTDKGAVARAVFNGDVVTAAFDQATKWVVMIRHGQYFTVYSNLEKVFVKAGDRVTTKQPVGIVYTNPSSGETFIQFIIAKGASFLNPASWLSGAH